MARSTLPAKSPGSMRSAAVVAPLVGVADLVDHGVQLFERLLAGGVAHPGKLAKVGVHRLFDLLDHGQRLALDVAGEGLGDEDLSQGFAQIPGPPGGRSASNAAAAACTPRRCLLKKSKSSLTKAAERIGRAIVGGVPAEVGLPFGEGTRFELVLHFREERRLGDVDHADGGEAAGLPVGGPVERGRHGGQFGARHFVELLVGVAEFHLGQRGFGERGFDLHDGLRLGLRGGGRIAEEFEHARHVLQVFGAGLFALGVGLGVVIAIGQAEAAGGGEGDHLFGVGEILVGAEAEDGVGACGLQVQARQNRRQVLQGVMPAMASRVDLSGAAPAFSTAASSMQAPKKSPIFCSFGDARGGGLGGLLQDSPEELQILLRQLAVDVPTRLVGRNGIQLVPVAAGVAPEIDAGVHGAIDEGGLQAGGVWQRGERAILRTEGRRNECQGEW